MKILIDDREADEVEAQHWLEWATKNVKVMKPVLRHFTMAYAERRAQEGK